MASLVVVRLVVSKQIDKHQQKYNDRDPCPDDIEIVRHINVVRISSFETIITSSRQALTRSDAYPELRLGATRYDHF